LQTPRGSDPAATSEQTPLAFAQVWQLPPQGPSQQVLSTQLPEAQSDGDAQVEPFAFLPIVQT
jgi:hypothetical protein